MKKYILIITVALALIGSIWGFVSLKKTTVSKEVDILSALPQTPYSLLRINNIEALSKALLYENSYWKDVSLLTSYNQVNTFLSVLDSIKESQPSVQVFLNQRTVYLGSFWDDNQQSQHLWFAQASADEWTALEELMQQEMTTGYYFSYQNGIFLVGTSPDLLQASIQQIKSEQSIMATNSDFSHMMKTGGKQAVFNWIFNMEMIGDYLLNQFTEQGQRMLSDWKQYAHWCCLDGIVEGDKLTLNGFAGKQEAFHSTSLMQGQSTGENTLTSRMPYNTYFFRHTALSDLEAYLTALQAYANQHAEENILTDGSHLETPSGESPLIYFRNYFGGELAYGLSPMGSFVIVKVVEPDKAAKALQHMCEDMGSRCKQSTASGIKTYQFDTQGFAGSVFGAYYTLADEHITLIGNKLVIASSGKFARYIASRNANTQTLQCAPNFKDANRTLLTHANVSMYANIPYMVRNAASFVEGSLLTWIKQTQSLWNNFSTFCLQAEDDLSGNTFQHLFLQYNKVKEVNQEALLASADAISDNEEIAMPNETPAPEELVGMEEPVTPDETDETEASTPTEEATNEATTNQPKASTVKRTISTQKPLCTATLEYPAAIPPQWVKNHYSGENEVAIQDTKNQLYLISASGKILWKKPLSARILGNITQVDLYKNNKLQMAFITAKELVVIDRNGNMVKGFPKALLQEGKHGLTVCDYDGSKNYRFFVPTANDILLLKADGSQPKDWQFASSKNGLQAPVQYIKQQGKDLLLAYSPTHCYILNRQGKERMHANESLKKAKNGLFYADVLGSNPRLIATTPQGEMMYIYNNEVKTSDVKTYTPNHLFTLFKGNYGNYYIFLDTQGLDVYDRDMNVYMQDKHVVAGTSPTLLMHGSKMAVFDSEQRCWIIYNLVSKRKAYQVFASDTPMAYFGAFKPYTSPCLVLTDGKQLKWYKVNEK